MAPTHGTRFRFEGPDPRAGFPPPYHHVHHRRGPEGRNSVYGNEDMVAVPREMLANLISGQQNNGRRVDHEGRRRDGGGDDTLQNILLSIGGLALGSKILPRLQQALQGSLLDRATGGILSGILGGVNDFFGFGRPERERGQRGAQGQAPGTVNDGSKPVEQWLQDGIQAMLQGKDGQVGIFANYDSQHATPESNKAYKQGATNFASEVLKNYFGGEVSDDGQTVTANKDTFVDKYVEHAQQEYDSISESVKGIHGEVRPEFVSTINDKLSKMGLPAATVTASGIQLPPFNPDSVKERALNIYNALKNKDADGDVTAESLAPIIAMADRGTTARETDGQSDNPQGKVNFNALHDMLGLIGGKDSDALGLLKQAGDFLGL